MNTLVSILLFLLIGMLPVAQADIYWNKRYLDGYLVSAKDFDAKDLHKTSFWGTAAVEVKYVPASRFSRQQLFAVYFIDQGIEWLSFYTVQNSQTSRVELLFSFPNSENTHVLSTAESAYSVKTFRGPPIENIFFIPFDKLSDPYQAFFPESFFDLLDNKGTVTYCPKIEEDATLDKALCQLSDEGKAKKYWSYSVEDQKVKSPVLVQLQ